MLVRVRFGLFALPYAAFAREGLSVAGKLKTVDDDVVSWSLCCLYYTIVYTMIILYLYSEQPGTIFTQLGTYYMYGNGPRLKLKMIHLK